MASYIPIRSRPLLPRSFSTSSFVPPQTPTASIRQSFLQSYSQGQYTKPHTLVPSSSLIPAASPASSDFHSIHFTNAGMVQFKDIFLGQRPPPAVPRAVSSQLCLRAGGKHNDLDNVGFTARHHTLFEMLGNFSFSDYGKEGAIYSAWRFLTENLGLPKERLRVTVYEEDLESVKLWERIAGWSGTESDSRILRLGRSDNYWSMGAGPGPCGPCTEIFWDQGKEINGDRWLEIWNLVFMQYQQADKPGEELPLGHTSVDTGMGLERIAAVLQGVDTNYDTDIFRPLVKRAKEILPNKSALLHWHGMDSSPSSVALKVLVDHVRAIAFLMADGIRPANQGRAYVLRRIIRRAITFAYREGIHEPVLGALYDPLIEAMGGQYPILVAQQAEIKAAILKEELTFLRTIRKGLELLESHMSRQSQSVPISGDLSFLLYDTFGFPLDLTMIIARARGFHVDEHGFEERMRKQKEMGRAAYEKSAKI